MYPAVSRLIGRLQQRYQSVVSSPTRLTWAGAQLLGVGVFSTLLGFMRPAKSAVEWLVLGLGIAATLGGIYSIIFASGVALRRKRAERLRSLGRCGKCGYDLTGNVCGRCPECGTPVPERDE